MDPVLLRLSADTRPCIHSRSGVSAFPSAERCHPSGPVPSSRFLTALAVSSARALRVCCAPLPARGSVRFDLGARVPEGPRGLSVSSHHFMPFEGCSSPIAVTHHCARCPPVVPLSSLPSLQRRNLFPFLALVRSLLQVLRSVSTSQGRFPVPDVRVVVSARLRVLRLSLESPPVRVGVAGFASRLRVALAVHRSLPPFVPARGSSVRPPVPRSAWSCFRRACASLPLSLGVRARHVRQSWVLASPGPRSSLSRARRYRGTPAPSLFAPRLLRTLMPLVSLPHRTA